MSDGNKSKSGCNYATTMPNLYSTKTKKEPLVVCIQPTNTEYNTIKCSLVLTSESDVLCCFKATSGGNSSLIR